MNEATNLKRDCEVIAIPRGRREKLPQGTSVRVLQARGGSYTVSTEIHAMYRIDEKDADALGLEFPADQTAPSQPGSLTEKLVWDALKTIYDPELPVNIVDLGLVYSCTITSNENGGETIAVRMAMTAPGCGMSDVIKADAESKLKRLPGVTEARVEVVFDPPWDPSRMSEEARLQLGMDFDSPSKPGFVEISRSS
jgi:probable FeS assembly SUF system protein SufT